MYSKFFSYLITFPFEQIGWGLRKLSLSGAAGNVFAIIIYILICLIPCLILWRLKKTERFLKTDFFLPFLSVLLFAVIYYMINPGLFYGGVPGAVNTLLGSPFILYSSVTSSCEYWKAAESQMPNALNIGSEPCLPPLFSCFSTSY